MANNVCELRLDVDIRLLPLPVLHPCPCPCGPARRLITCAEQMKHRRATLWRPLPLHGVKTRQDTTSRSTLERQSFVRDSQDLWSGGCVGHAVLSRDGRRDRLPRTTRRRQRRLRSSASNG